MTRNVTRILKNFFLGLLGLLLVLWVVLRFFGVMGMTPKEVDAYFEGKPKSPQSQFYEISGRKMHYEILSGKNKPTIVFIHGSPGSWDAFVSFFADSALVDKAQLVSVDRIGYGQSEPGNPESSLYWQAALLKPVLDSVQSQRPVILVGHSYGGPVAARLAMDYPGMVDGLVLVAGLTDPVLEERLAIQKPLQSPWLRWLMPEGLDVSNREIVPLKGELQEIANRWGEIQAECYIIQGGKDILVDPGHADFAESRLINTNFTTLRIPSENHFIPWTHPELIKDALWLLMDCPEL